jgi:ribonucleoside-triphosphate reductase
MKVLSKPQLSRKEVFTLDLETETTHTYQLSNGIVSHNTASCLLGCASGIHPHHARRYMRQVQANKMEMPFIAFSKVNPHACEDSVWSANKTDAVISFCCEVDVKSKIKSDMTAVEFLEMVKLTQNNWIAYGKTTELCTQPWLSHNVSNTCTVANHEWEEVGNFIFDNQNSFTAVSLLGMTGDKDYQQAPFQAVYDQNEIDTAYGAEAAQGAVDLVTKGVEVFGNLWNGCDFVLKNDSDICEDSCKNDWITSVRLWADQNFSGDRQIATYCLKDVHNLAKFEKLKSCYREVDYVNVVENEDNTRPSDSIACAGGSCSIEF